MTGRRFLLMHITSRTGHYRASRAIEQTLGHLDPSARIVGVDAGHYSSRIVRWAISRSYYSLIRHQPDVWEYLYDNPVIHRRVRHFQALLHRYHAAKLQQVIDEVRPDAIACTQAYPCGMVADFKRHRGLTVPLVGILTDYAPHLYWFHDTVDTYVVPSEQVKQRFITRGIDASRVQVLGIPIDLRFQEPCDREEAAQAFGLDPAQPILLVMGGSGGFGQIREILLNLDTLPHPCQFAIVAGTNRALLHWLRTERFRHRVVAFGYSDEIHRLMRLSTLLLSKPGGLTTAEALATHLPMVIVSPIPGQEAYNARFLLSQGAAVQAGSPETVRQTVRDLLESPEQLERLRRRNAELARPDAALDIAKLLMELADQRHLAARAVGAG
jgi:processive 1,2-diacylglycerol beta-glucosyltransferase